MEGTPFLISSATSLSDIIGELDNQGVAPFLIPAPGAAPQVQIPPSSASGQNEPEQDIDPDDPIYSDVALLQKCINKGRAVGILKKAPTVDEEEVDLSYLIQKGRKQLFTRSEDNLKQYTAPASNNHERVLPAHISAPAESPAEATGQLAQKPMNGSLPSLNQNYRVANINLNVVPPTVHEIMKDMKTELTDVDCITVATAALKINPSQHQRGHLSPNANTIHCTSDETDAKSVHSNNNNNVKESGTDDTDNDTHSQSDDTTWTDDTPTFSSPIPSMSISKALKKVAAQVEETLSEIDQPTLESLGTTLDSAGYHTDSLQRRIQNKQLLLLQTSSSQVSNLLNQKPPQEFFDLDSSMISVASIKSEIFDDGIPSSPQLSSCSAQQPPAQCTPTQHAAIASTDSSHSNSPAEAEAPLTPPSKYDTYVIKRVESPKNRRRNDPERYLTRTIEKCDLKLKPPVPPKPSSSCSTAAVRPTRASELRATRSREHSPTNSTTSLVAPPTASVKIPPKPPVRSTPPLNNTTLPRNTKLMEGNNTKLMDGNNQQNGPNANGVESPPLLLQQPPSHHNHQPPLPQLPAKDSKLNFGGRIGNLFRKSFNKEKDGSGKLKKESNGGSNIWVKRREKALVPPFNYKPPTDQQTGSNVSIPSIIQASATTASPLNAGAITASIPNLPATAPPPAQPNNNTAHNNNSNNSSSTTTGGTGKSSKITTV